MFVIPLLFVLNLVVLVCGIVLLCLTIAWKPQRGKGLFVAFVALAWVAFPVSQFLFVGIMFLMDAGRGGYRMVEVAAWLNSVILIAMFISTLVLLLAYSIARLPGDQPSGSSAKLGAVEPRESWETNLPPKKLIQILRRREWAFLADCGPAILLFVGTISFAAYVDNFGSYRRNAVVVLAYNLMTLLDLLLFVYVVFRDSVGGASFGKRIVGCRVVNLHDGATAGFGVCLVRNLLFLIPLMPLVELATASIRTDRRRIGDLLAGTMVVHGPPTTVDGVKQQIAPSMRQADPAPVKHPLDD